MPTLGGSAAASRKFSLTKTWVLALFSWFYRGMSGKVKPEAPRHHRSFTGADRLQKHKGIIMSNEHGAAQDDYWALAGDRQTRIRSRMAKIDGAGQPSARTIFLLMIGRPLRRLFDAGQDHDFGPQGFCISAPAGVRAAEVFRPETLMAINQGAIADFNKNAGLLAPEIRGLNNIAQPWNDITKAWAGIVDHIEGIQAQYAPAPANAGQAIYGVDNAARAAAMGIVAGDPKITGATAALADLAILSAAKLVNDAGEMLYFAINCDFRDPVDNAEFQRLLNTILAVTGDGASELPVAIRVIIATIRAAMAMAMALDLYCVTRSTGHRTVISPRLTSGRGSNRATTLDIVNYQPQWTVRPVTQEAADRIIYGKNCCPSSDPNDDFLAAAFKTRLLKDVLDPKLDSERLSKICEAFHEYNHFDQISTIMSEMEAIRDSHLTSKPSQFTAVALAAMEREIIKAAKHGGEFVVDSMLTAFDSYDDVMRITFPILRGRDAGVFRGAIAVSNPSRIEISNLYAPSIKHLRPIAETRCSEDVIGRYASEVLPEKTWLGVNVGKSYIGKLLLGCDQAGAITPFTMPHPKRTSAWRRAILGEWLGSATAFVSSAVGGGDSAIVDVALRDEIAALFNAVDGQSAVAPVNCILELYDKFNPASGAGPLGNSLVTEASLKTSMPGTIAFDLLSKTTREKRLTASVMASASALIHAGILDVIFQITELSCRPTLDDAGRDQMRYIFYAAKQIILSINMISGKDGRSIDEVRIDGIVVLGITKWLKFMANQKICAVPLAKTPDIAKQMVDQVPLLFNGPRPHTYDHALEVAMGLTHQDDLMGLRILPPRLFDLGVGIEFFDLVIGAAYDASSTDDEDCVKAIFGAAGTDDDPLGNPARGGAGVISGADAMGAEGSLDLTTMAIDTRQKRNLTDKQPPRHAGVKVFLDKISMGRNTDFPMSGMALKMSAESNTPLYMVSHEKAGVAMEAMITEFPWMESEIRFIFERTRFNGIKMPPIMLVGLPGTGKSMFARRLAELLGMPNIVYAVSTSADSSFAGTPRQWSTSRMSVPLQQVVKSGLANPMIILDEIEKGATSNHNGSLISAILPFLEKSTASSVFDPACEVGVNLSAVNYIATANRTDHLDPALLSRFTVVKFKPPTIRDIPRLVACIAYSKREVIPDAAYRLTDEEIVAITKAWRGGTLRRLDKMVEATLLARRMTCMMN